MSSATGSFLAVDLGTARTKVRDASRLFLDEPTLLSRDRRGTPAAGWDAWAAGTESPGSTVLHHPIRHALVADPAACVEFLRALVPKERRPMWGTVAVSIPSAASAGDARTLGAVLSTALGAIVIPIDTLATGALGARLPVANPEGVLVCDLGAGIVESAIVGEGRRGAAQLMARASADVGTHTWSEDPARFVDAVRTTLNLVLAQDPYAVGGANPDRPVHLIGGGTLLPGVVTHLRDALNVRVTVPVDARHAVVRGLSLWIDRTIF